MTAGAHEPSWDRARDIAHAAATALRAEEVPLALAHGRTLAAAITSATDLPPWDYSAMDGWAVCGPAPWQVVDRVLAGSLPTVVLESGTACAIATGAPIPQGTQAIVRREHGIVVDDLLHMEAQREEPSVGTDIRWGGEECRAGEVVVPAGRRLTPAVIGLAAAAGADVVVVRRRPTAALVVLGDELLADGPARDGRVRDSLTPQVPGWLERMGVEVVATTRVEDTLPAHVAAIASARDVDIVITTGGTAAGPVDHVHAALEAVGAHLLVDSVACRPGHPQLLASLGDHRFLLGLPGNPQSAIVALMTLGQALVDGLMGRRLSPLDDIEVAQDVTAPAGETRLVASRRRGSVAEPTAHLGSGMLRGLAQADGFAVIPPGGVAAGAVVRWLPLPQ